MAGDGHMFSRQELLIGEDGLKALSGSRVAVFGMGGVGSYCAEALVRAGIGEVTFVDSDFVQASNVNRQLIALSSTLGRPKVDVMAERARDINPGIRVNAVRAWFGPENADELLSGGFDYVADAIDSVESKLLLIMKCVGAGTPIVSSMGAGNKLDATGFRIADISKTHTCPLARTVRARLRKEGIREGVTVVFSEGEPVRSEPGPPGSISYVPPVAGLLMAQVIIAGILGRKALPEG